MRKLLFHTFLILFISGTCYSVAQAQIATPEKNVKSPLSPVVKIDSRTNKLANSKEIQLSDFHYEPEDQNTNGGKNQSGFIHALQTKPGLSFLSSGIVPGSGQAVNHKWVRAGIYFLAEAAAITIHIDRMNTARQQEDAYHKFVNSNWSVVNYAKWLVDYYNQHHEGANIQYNDLGNNLNDGPAYNTSVDWKRVDLNKLHTLEKKTYYYYPDRPHGEIFSHELPDYGSQQYYELVSKYFQFGTGWRDFGTNRNGQPLDNIYALNWDGTDMPANFFKGADKAAQFNDNYRLAGDMLTLLIVNHIISAFDAYFTVKLNQNKLQAHASMLGNDGGYVALTYRF